LVDRLAGWLVDWLTGWLVDRLTRLVFIFICIPPYSSISGIALSIYVSSVYVSVYHYIYLPIHLLSVYLCIYLPIYQCWRRYKLTWGHLGITLGPLEGHHVSL
jgi:hypothetical protein